VGRVGHCSHDNNPTTSFEFDAYPFKAINVLQISFGAVLHLIQLALELTRWPSIDC